MKLYVLQSTNNDELYLFTSYNSALEEAVKGLFVVMSDNLPSPGDETIFDMAIKSGTSVSEFADIFISGSFGVFVDDNYGDDGLGTFIDGEGIVDKSHFFSDYKDILQQICEAKTKFKSIEAFSTYILNLLVIISLTIFGISIHWGLLIIRL